MFQISAAVKFLAFFLRSLLPSTVFLKGLIGQRPVALPILEECNPKQGGSSPMSLNLCNKISLAREWDSWVPGRTE